MRKMPLRVLLGASAGLAVLGLLAGGCDSTDRPVRPPNPSAPFSLSTVTGDREVTLHWQAGDDAGRSGFAIYQASGALAASAPNTIPPAFGARPVATIDAASNAGDFTAQVIGLTDGTTYSFLVVALSHSEGEPSRPSNIVSDTPRIESGLISFEPVGVGRFLNLSTLPPYPASDSSNADIVCQVVNTGAGLRPGIAAINGARIQDRGWVASWDEVDKAPLGSAAYPVEPYALQVLPRHVYVVYTWHNHYAKIWVDDVHSYDLGYDMRVAFQSAEANPELAPRR